MTDQVSASTLLALARAGTAAVANAIELHKVRLRNEGYLDSTIAPRAIPNRPMVGHALTLEMRTDLPPTTGTSYLDRTDWWERLASGPHPKVIVIADVGERRGAGAVAGEIHASIFQALGAVGIVTDGAVRDLDPLSRLDLHVYAGTVSPSHGYAHVVSVGQPVTIGGLKITSGDLLHGDRDGIVQVPASIAAALPDTIARMTTQEGELLRLCRARDFSVTALRDALGRMPDLMGPS
jgi:regulator of RNase E activity RraA